MFNKALFNSREENVKNIAKSREENVIDKVKSREENVKNIAKSREENVIDKVKSREENVIFLWLMAENRIGGRYAPSLSIRTSLSPTNAKLPRPIKRGRGSKG